MSEPMPVTPPQSVRINADRMAFTIALDAVAATDATLTHSLGRTARGPCSRLTKGHMFDADGGGDGTRDRGGGG